MLFLIGKLRGTLASSLAGGVVDISKDLNILDVFMSLSNHISPGVSDSLLYAEILGLFGLVQGSKQANVFANSIVSELAKYNILKSENITSYSFDRPRSVRRILMTDYGKEVYLCVERMKKSEDVDLVD